MSIRGLDIEVTCVLKIIELALKVANSRSFFKPTLARSTRTQQA